MPPSGISDGAWHVDGDPMEGALVTAAVKAALDPAALRAAHPRLDEIPFDARHRLMATLHDTAGGTIAHVKGAPERLLELCGRQMGSGGPGPIEEKGWRDALEDLTSEGQRVLAIAVREFGPGKRTLHLSDLESGLVLLGLVGLIDPPRREAMDAVRECHAAGIRVKMITGDHAGTARAIARQLGLTNRTDVATGRDLETLDFEALRRLAATTDVFARTSPEDKLRLVEALQADGAVVAMTGDGVNDAPALKRADVGVAMGLKGTEVAKEASEMVLADDNFATIVAAVREGRTVYDNVKKVLAWTLPTNGGEALCIITAVLLGLTLPITAVQILWINLVTSVGLGLTLAFEPTEPNAMSRPPRAPGEPLLSGTLAWRVVLVSLLFVAGAFGIFVWMLERGAEVEHARTAVVNTIVVMEIAYLFSVRYLALPSFTLKGATGTPAVWLGLAAIVALQLAFTYLPALQGWFGSRPLDLVEGAAVIGVGVAMFVLLEVEKAVRSSTRRFGFARG